MDILVNNAGWDLFKPFVDTNPEDWQRIIAINLVGILNLHHVVLPAMVKNGGGRVVNVASDAARVVGEKKAREMWYLCQRYSAEEALAMGLVNTVVPHDELDAEVQK